MTSMTLPDEVLKTDVLGRVRIKKARRNALLDKFERGGASAQAMPEPETPPEPALEVEPTSLRPPSKHQRT